MFGERTPYFDPEVRGAFIGLGARHTQAHLIRAVLEGVAYSLQDTFTVFAELGIPVHSVRLGGGGARSPLWRQMQADIYGRAVQFLAAEEGAAYGAALLAGVGAGAWSDVDTACETSIQVAGQLEPRSDHRSVYEAGYNTYRRIYPALASLRRVGIGDDCNAYV